MKFVRFFSFLTAFALLIVIGCGSTDQPENPAANNNQGTVSIAGAGGTGGASVSVDSVCNGNCGRDNQDNTIRPNFIAIAWINTSGNDCSSTNYYYDIYDGADLVVDCVPLGDVDDPCPGKWQGYEFVTPMMLISRLPRLLILSFIVATPALPVPRSLVGTRSGFWITATAQSNQSNF